MRARVGTHEAPRYLLAGAGFASLLLVAFSGLLGAADDVVASSFLGDTARGFHPARLFAVEQLRAGNLPLWDPHSFSGVPFLGAFQPAVLYPPNAGYLWLPIAAAINLELALHLFVLGMSTFAWLRGRGLHPLAAFYAGAVLLLAAPIWHRVLAGQLSVLDTLAWVPLLLLSVDRILERPTLGFTLLGIAAASLMILAGHPPTVYMMVLATALYAAPRWWRCPRRGAVLAAFAAVAVAPLFITAAQLWTGLAVASEGVRTGGLPYAQATAGSLPPQHLLTLFAPHLYGGVYHFSGSTFYWDATVFVGSVTLLLAFHGAVAGNHPLRRAALALAVLFLVLALGRYGLLYALPYHLLPGFDFVRAPSKFMYASLFFTALLAAIGLDRLLVEPRAGRPTLVAAAAIALSCLGGAALLALRGGGPAQGTWFSSAWPELARSGGVAVLAAGLLFGAHRLRVCVPVLVGLALLELLVFARGDLDTTALDGITGISPELRAAYATQGDERVIFLHQARKTALVTGGYDAWGWDPVQLQRYAAFVAYTQGRDGALAMDNVGAWPPQRPHPLLRLVRVGRVLYGKLRSPQRTRIPDPLPRFLLLRDARVVADGEATLAELSAPGFDPLRTVLLEEPPQPPPDPEGRGGTVRVLGESTDHVDLAVSLDSAAVLLETDAWARGWRAVALPGSDADAYALLRADYTLRAVPLGPGRHRLRLEYRPRAFVAGRIASAVSLAGFVGAVGLWGWRRRRGMAAPPGGSGSGAAPGTLQRRSPAHRPPQEHA